MNNAGVISSTYLALLQGKFTTFHGVVTWVLLHDSASPGAPAPTVITAFNVDSVIATQRRRLRP